jgi:hypothetical protein
MKLIARAEHPLQAAIWAGALRAAGIRCEVRNTVLSGALGQIPFLECAPQLWLLDERDAARADEILREIRQAVQGPPWRCSECGEELEAQFGSCWKCGSSRPG